MGAEIPTWLGHVEFAFGRYLSNARARTWQREFRAALRAGPDLDAVKRRFVITLVEAERASFDHHAPPARRAACDRALALWRRDDLKPGEWIREGIATAIAAGEAEAWVARSAGYATYQAQGAAKAMSAAVTGSVGATWWDTLEKQIAAWSSQSGLPWSMAEEHVDRAAWRAAYRAENLARETCCGRHADAFLAMLREARR